jgi:hypothetical protein
VSSRTTPTDSQYELVIILQHFGDTDSAQLCQAAIDYAASKYSGTAVAIAFSDWYFLLGTCQCGASSVEARRSNEAP